MRRSAMQLFSDRSGDDAARIEAASEVGRELAEERPLASAWSAVCAVAFDDGDSVDVRCAAVRAMANAPAAAPNQLVRRFDDPERAVRKEAVAVLRSLPAQPHLQRRLIDEVTAAEGSDPLLSLLNLAPTFGYDARITAVYQKALASSDPAIRAAGVGRLAMVGEMTAAIAAVTDPATEVREEAANALAGYSTREPAEIAAVRSLADDANDAVRRAARRALRILGVEPIAKPRQPVLTASPVDPLGWRPLLDAISMHWLADRDHAAGLDDAIIEGGWLGREPASSAGIHELEERMGQPLPPSYSAFLSITDGFGRVSPFIDEVFAAADVRPFVDENADWIAAYAEGDPALGDLLSVAWQLSAVHDGVVLLNPDVVGADGEWEALLFANWIPGAERHPSFLALIKASAGK